jgi:hypothetical protein
MYQKTDRFGNPYVNVRCRDKSGNGYFKGFVEVGGKLLQIEVQPQTSSDKKYGDEIMWARVTEKRKQPRSGGAFGGRR